MDDHIGKALIADVEVRSDDSAGPPANGISVRSPAIRPKVLGLFVALGLLWGMPYLLIRIAVEDLHPVALAFGRTFLGAAILIPFALPSGALKAGLRHWRWLLAYTLVEISGPWVLIGYAETVVNSSTAGLLIATTPIVAALMSAGLGHERIGAARLCGLLLGFGGVALLLGADLGIDKLPAAAALILSAVGYAAGPIIAARKLDAVSSMGVVAGSLILATVIYLPAVPFFLPEKLEPRAVASVVGLSIFCTALPFLLLSSLIREVGPARSTIITYINPAVALVLGVAVLDEPLTIGLLAGLPLIVIGSFLGARRAQGS
ncbi:MAG TPA: DMT family transporter [Sphingomicrobium sp.]